MDEEYVLHRYIVPSTACTCDSEGCVGGSKVWLSSTEQRLSVLILQFILQNGRGALNYRRIKLKLHILMFFCDSELTCESRSGYGLINEGIVGTLIKKPSTGHCTVEIRRYVSTVGELVVISDS